MLNATIAAPIAKAWATFFDPSFRRGGALPARAGGACRLGPLSGTVIHLVPRELAVLALEVEGGRDLIAAFNFFDLRGSTKLVVNLVNVPSDREGDAMIAAMEAELAALRAAFPSQKPGSRTEMVKARAGRAKAARAKSARARSAPAKGAVTGKTGAAPPKRAPAKTGAAGKSRGAPAKAARSGRPRSSPSKS